MDAQATIAQYDSALHQMLDENEALRAQLAELRGEVKRLVDWIMGDRDALHCLQSIYNSPYADQSCRIRAAAAAIPSAFAAASGNGDRCPLRPTQ
jgi:hypothetical protein